MTEKDSRRTLTFDVEARSLEDGEKRELIAEGYAAKFNSPTVLFEYDGVEYREVIAPGAFDGADMTDVIFNYDHKGKVLARNRNGTLDLTVDNVGLRIKAKLHGTAEGRTLHQEISDGYIDKMSFQFKVAEERYDTKTRTRTILKFKRIYDVAAVSMPAYQDTNISARSFFEAEAEKEKREAADAEQRQRLILLLKTFS
jgi:hypothetical protein